jgi:hypothetical protein
MRYSRRRITQAHLRGEKGRIVPPLRLRRVAGDLLRNRNIGSEQLVPRLCLIEARLCQFEGVRETISLVNCCASPVGAAHRPPYCGHKHYAQGRAGGLDLRFSYLRVSSCAHKRGLPQGFAGGAATSKGKGVGPIK